MITGNKDADYVPDESNESRPGTRSQKKAPKPAEKNKQAAGAASAGEMADLARSKDRAADADVTSTSGPEEQVFLSAPYFRERVTPSGMTTHKCWAIVVFTYSKQDNKAVTMQMIDVEGNAIGVLDRCRVRKNRFPWVFMGNKLTTFCDEVFGGDPIAAKGFSEGIIESKDECDNQIVVDVHFDEPMLGITRRVTDLHLKLFRAGSKKCDMCRLRDIMELPNVVAYEVEAVKFKKSANASTRGTETEAEISSE